MDKFKKYLNFPREVRMQFLKDSIAELYTFTDDDIEFYNDKLDFNILSYNSKIKWSYPLLEKYRDKWDWNSIEQNDLITKKFNLALLFPDKVTCELSKCTCFRNLDFCENLDYNCEKFEKPVAIVPRIIIKDLYVYRLIDYLISIKGINDKALLMLYLLDKELEFVGKDDD
ncbi:hypothetical protein DR871_003925 [Flavobacterium petrolei]|uniref:Uncharacterized protein n=1 Tax=Flavobacterium petrolei TaxID=2259594 RepID=A0A482TKA4_9FLAO|nr:hypothetical protein [Flavobacterium petrolei]RYJ53205.1 hypothetical protein DR871_003925 [Flavobacterium petrolei]